MNIKKITAIFASAVLVSGFSVGNCFASTEILNADAADVKLLQSDVKYGKGEFQENINYYKGANIAGFVKVADAMIAQGI